MKNLTGYGLVVVSAVGFATLGILGRYAYAAGMDTSTILFVRFGLAAVLIGLLLAFRHEKLPAGRALWLLVGMGAIGYVGQAYAFLSALKYASPGLVGFLLYLYPTFVAILSALFLHEKISLVKAFALLLALTGTALTVDPSGGQLPGVILAICAAAIYSVYIIVGSQVMKQVSAIQSSFIIFASAAVSSGLLLAFQGPRLPVTMSGWGTMAAMIILATVLPVAMFLGGIERVGPTRAALVSNLEPVVTVILAAVLLDETISPAAMLGGALILGAALLIAWQDIHPANLRLKEPSAS